jgi:hypothetical protein
MNNQYSKKNLELKNLKINIINTIFIFSFFLLTYLISTFSTTPSLNIMIPASAICIYRFFLSNTFIGNNENYDNENLINFYGFLFFSIFILPLILFISVAFVKFIITLNIYAAIILGCLYLILFSICMFYLTFGLILATILMNDISFSLILIYIIIEAFFSINNKPKTINTISFIFCYIFIFLVKSVIFSSFPDMQHVFNLDITKKESYNIIADIRNSFQNQGVSLTKNMIAISILSIKDIVFFILVSLLFFKNKLIKLDVTIINFIVIINMFIILFTSIYDYHSFKEYIIINFFMTLYAFSMNIIKETKESYHNSLEKLNNNRIKILLGVLLFIPILIFINQLSTKDISEYIVFFISLIYYVITHYNKIPNFSKRRRIITSISCLFFIVLSVLLAMVLDNIKISLPFIIFLGYSIININTTINKDKYYTKWVSKLSVPEKRLLDKYNVEFKIDSENEIDTEQLIEKLTNINKDRNITNKFNEKNEELIEHLKESYVIYHKYDQHLK